MRDLMMCHVDVTPRTFEWSSQGPDRVPVMKPQATRVCRKWEPLAEFARAHYPSSANGPILENPQYGECTQKRTIARPGRDISRLGQQFMGYSTRLMMRLCFSTGLLMPERLNHTQATG